MSWDRGREEIVAMLDRRKLTQVAGNLDLARRLLASAHRHLTSADSVADDDPELAYAALHDAVRKAMSAMLQAQGLRATSAGSHIAVQTAVRAQFATSMGALLRPVDRTTRHAVEYPSSDTWIDTDAVRADLPLAVALVEAAETAVDHLPVFVR